MGLRENAIQGVGWSFGGSIINFGITFVVGIVLARLLSPEEYGLIGLAMVFVTVFSNIVDSGFSSALIRNNEASDEDFCTAFWTNLSFALVMYAVLYLCAPAIAGFFDKPELGPVTRVMGVCLILNACAMIQSTQLSREINFRMQTRCSVISALLSGAVGIWMAFAGYGVWALVGQQLSRYLFQMLLLWYFRKWRPALTFSIVSFRKMWAFGWKLTVSGLIDSTWNQIYQVVIGKVYTPTTLGLYSKAHEFVNFVSSNLTTVVRRVSYPTLSKLQGDDSRLREGYRRVIRVTMLVTFVFVIGMAACAREFVYVLIGAKWLPCVPFMQILCFQMMLYPLHALNLNILQVRGRSDLFLRLEILKKSISLIPILLGIFVGIWWMLYASLAAGLVAYYLNATYSGPLIDYSLKDQIRDISKSFGIAVVMGLCVWALSFLPISPYVLLPLQLIIGAAIAIWLCEMTGLPEYMEIKDIIRQVMARVCNKR